MTVSSFLRFLLSDQASGYLSSKGGRAKLPMSGVDLYIPVLTFVFGEAQLSGSGAIVSTHRLHNEFYGLPPNNDLFLQRLLKEVIHELGHTFGLLHCRNYECVMHASTYVEDIDLKQARLCEDCGTFLSGTRSAKPHQLPAC